MRIRNSSLYTTREPVREIALVAGLPEQPKLLLSRDTVERTFERLAATVLILREFMHHLQFLTITVNPDLSPK